MSKIKDINEAYFRLQTHSFFSLSLCLFVGVFASKTFFIRLIEQKNRHLRITAVYGIK